MKKLFREPLVHFLGGALLVFAFFWATGADRDPADYHIELTQGDIDRLAAGWQQNFRRPPTKEELDGLIEQELSEEIYYREALRLGLDRNDPVVRRRLTTKMQFLNAEDADSGPPDDKILQKWLDDHADKYVQSSVYDFDQIYLGQQPQGDPVKLLAGLNDGSVKPADIAQTTLLPGTLTGVHSSEIARQFGEKFAASLEGLGTRKWAGPIASGFGVHLVKITAKRPSERASLDQVRQQVINDWQAAQNAAREKRIMDQYRAQYDITVAGRK